MRVYEVSSRNFRLAASRCSNRRSARIGATIVSSLLEMDGLSLSIVTGHLLRLSSLLTRGKGAIVSGDLSNDEDLFKIIEEIHDHEFVKEAGGIDLLVHNASIYNRGLRNCYAARTQEIYLNPPRCTILHYPRFSSKT